MLQFDKIKLVTSLNNINNINEDKFSKTESKRQVQNYKYNQKEPYALYIEVDEADKELVIEFTGKILRDQYPELITQNNIRVCLENINALGLCLLDIDAIIRDSIVVKVDVTADIPCNNCKDLVSSLHAGISNYQKYISRRIKDNCVIDKNVQTKNRKLRLSVYDKAKEMQLVGNEAFLGTLNAPDTLIQYFQGKIRFELNLNSKEQIRKNLKIPNTQLIEVLNSTANPIMTFIDKAIDDNAEVKSVKTLRDYERLAVLRECGNNLEKVERIIRVYSSPTTHITQAIKPYKQLAAAKSNSSIKDMLRNLLFEVFIIGTFVLI